MDAATGESVKQHLSRVVIVVLLLCVGCATAHRQLTDKTAVLGRPFLQCSTTNDCRMVQNMEVPGARPGATAQLTRTGCVLHTLATGGHVAWECRNGKAERGQWLWRRGKDKGTNK